MSKEQTIKALADFMTGPTVVESSVGLQLGGARQASAERFFAIRNAFGVSGYMPADEAERAIYRALDIQP